MEECSKVEDGGKLVSPSLKNKIKTAKATINPHKTAEFCKQLKYQQQKTDNSMGQIKI